MRDERDEEQGTDAGLSRRELLRRGLGVGAAIALGGEPWTRALARRHAEPDALLSRPIPSSGERIPIVGVGTARRWESATSEDAREPLRAVLRDLPRLGGRLIDTAPSYGDAERVVGELVEGIGNRDALFLATKVGRGREGREAGIAEMEESFRRLRTTRIDLMQVHNLGGAADMLPVLRDWKRAGRIRYYGVTTSFDRQYDALEALLRAESMDFVQLDYAIDDRGAETRLLPLARDKGIAVLTNLPFGRGRVFEKLGRQPIPGWARELGIATWAQFALKFVLSHPAVTAAIPGTSRPAHLADNLGAARAPMPDDATRARMAALVAAG